MDIRVLERLKKERKLSRLFDDDEKKMELREVSCSLYSFRNDSMLILIPVLIVYKLIVIANKVFCKQHSNGYTNLEFQIFQLCGITVLYCMFVRER